MELSAPRAVLEAEGSTELFYIIADRTSGKQTYGAARFIYSDMPRDGKVVGEAKVELMGSADIIEWFAEEGRRAYGRIIPARADGVRNMVLMEPVGIVAGFSPCSFTAPTPPPERPWPGFAHVGFGNGNSWLRSGPVTFTTRRVATSAKRNEFPSTWPPVG